MFPENKTLQDDSEKYSVEKEKKYEFMSNDRQCCLSTRKQTDLEIRLIKAETLNKTHVPSFSDNYYYAFVLILFMNAIVFKYALLIAIDICDCSILNPSVSRGESK